MLQFVQFALGVSWLHKVQIAVYKTNFKEHTRWLYKPEYTTTMYTVISDSLQQTSEFLNILIYSSSFNLVSLPTCHQKKLPVTACIGCQNFRES